MSYDNLKLEKGMYSSSLGLTGTLEKLDPSENYEDSPLRGLDAYERQLKRFAIKTSGQDSSDISAFFKTSDAAVLFPEYVQRAVRAGMDESDFVPDIVAATTKINSMDYRTISLDMEPADREMPVVSEGELLSTADIKVSDRCVRLKKRGKLITTSYDVLRFQRLDIVALALRRIGTYLAQSLMADAVDTLINGDGDDNPAAQTEIQSYSFDALVDFWNSFSPYEMNTLVASPDAAAAILKLSEFRDSAAGMSFHADGKMISPLGARLIKTSHLTAQGALIGLDRRCAIEHIKVGEIETDYSKLIDRQLEQIAITSINGFAKIMPDASKMLVPAGN